MLQLAMPQVQAWEKLQDAKYCGKLSMVGLYDLMLRAGYSEDIAQETANQRGWDRLNAGMKV